VTSGGPAVVATAGGALEAVGNCKTGSPRQSFHISVAMGARSGLRSKEWSNTASCTNLRSVRSRMPATISRKRSHKRISADSLVVPGATEYAASR